MICAGEASGDRLGAELVVALRRRIKVETFGLVGPDLRSAGVSEIAGFEGVSAVGLAEAARVVPAAVRTLTVLTDALRTRRPDLLLTIDSPSLLLRLGRRAKRMGIPTLHWVSPQVWAWRAGRIRTLGRRVDGLMCLFPMEPALFRGTGIRTVFVGHPLADRVGPSPRQAGTFGLAPGSRRGEIDAHWPVFRRVGEELLRRGKQVRVSVAPTVDSKTLSGLSGATRHAGLRGLYGCDGVLVASGTATLELGLAATPMVVAYRVHPVTYALGRALIRTRFLALPNVLAGRRLVPEHVQWLSPERLTADLLSLAGPAGEAQRRGLRLVAGGLQRGGVRRAADEVCAWLGAP